MALHEVVEDGTEPQPRPVPGTGSIGHLLQSELAHRLTQLREQDTRVLRGADGAVHKMRITVRRLRATLSTYGPILEGGSTVELRDELRWVGAELSGARDAQVLRERIDSLLQREPPELVLGPVSSRIVSEMAGRHRDGMQRARSALDSDRYRRLLGTLDEFVTDPPFAAAAAEEASEQLPQLLTRDLKRVRRRAGTAEAAAGTDRHDVALHEMRKAAKRLRYAAESATPVFGRATRLGSRAKRLQELLGEHQDTVVSRAALRELAAQADLADENGFTFGRLHALEQARADQLVDECSAALARLPEQRLERWLRE